ncbi:MAG: hypothetical protein HQL32_07695 [Planctomycetes bacterium]|nr:hypothetical protein [Planctomycetota bacterium]
MKFITFSGPPSTGKTSVIIKAFKPMIQDGLKIGVVKFDCLSTEDDLIYSKNGFTVKKGISGAMCPDHFFVSNIEEILEWGQSIEADILISESAGLCNRCSPYIKDIKAVCVIDNLCGLGTPKKIGPMLKTADIVVITKGDIVSQAEREVFSASVTRVNPKAITLHVNGLSGQGAFEFASLVMDKPVETDSLAGKELRFPMPSAMCSYCLGETRIGKEYQHGNVRKI